jgi:flavin reductase (DIM6/NTAB) family NADH-FMN oxidoreductase RutF
MSNEPIQRRRTPPDADEVPSLNSEAFTRAFRNHPAGVAVITADPGDGPVGLTASSVISVSADPPLLAFSVSDQSSSADALRRASTVVVHLLEADQVDLAKLCAAEPSARFANAEIWERLSTDEPCFKESANWIRGEIVDRIRAGSATLMVIRALSAKPSEAPIERDTVDALIYHNRTWRRLGDTAVG